MTLVPIEVDGKVYGVDVAHLKEIINTPPITPVPFAPQWVAGVANIRGDLATIISLPDRLGDTVIDRAGLRQAPQVVVIQHHGRVAFGALVHRVGPVRTVGEDQLTPAQHVCERGRVIVEQISMGVLNPETMIQK